MIYSDDSPGPELLQVLSGPEESDPDKRQDRIGSLQSYQSSNGAEALDGKILHDTEPARKKPHQRNYRFSAYMYANICSTNIIENSHPP